MITFSGEVSDNARFFMKKLEARFPIIITSIVSIIFCIPILMFCIYVDWIAAVFFVPMSLPVLYGVLYRVMPVNLKRIRYRQKYQL